ncbi:MAG: hypothetical protein GXO09_06770 [Crenarchaeota archaeon]|nr:hypothetical protein [Thermoproteota archaeon]
MKKQVKNPVVSALMIGIAYGVYRVVGCAQPLMNVIAYHAGREVGSLVRDAASPEDALRKAADMLGLADRFTVTRDGDVIEVVVEGCNVCPKRVGGYEIKGTACPVPGLLLGVLSSYYGVRIPPHSVNKHIKWGVGEKCRFRLSVKL